MDIFNYQAFLYAISTQVLATLIADVLEKFF